MRQVKKEIRETKELLYWLLDEMCNRFEKNKRKRQQLIYCYDLSIKVRDHSSKLNNSHIKYALATISKWYQYLDNLSRYGGRITQDEADLYYRIRELIGATIEMLKLADEL